MTVFDRLMANRWHLQITTPAQARDFLENLVAKGLAFHPDDPPDCVICDGKRVFSDHEAPYVSKRMQEAKAALGEGELYDALMPPDVERLTDELQCIQDKLQTLLEEQQALINKLAKLA